MVIIKSLVKENRGFSLVELMIAVAIIGVLSVVALASYTDVQKKGRDSRRQSDLALIQDALEHYHTDRNSYPNTLGLLTTNPLNIIYVSTLPVDPNGSSYTYTGSDCSGTPATSCVKYSLCATLEQSPATSYCVTSP